MHAEQLRINISTDDVLLRQCQLGSDKHCQHAANQEEQQDANNNSGTTPWRQFFTDPNLVTLIETALKNNQELLITLQEIEIAKSGVCTIAGGSGRKSVSQPRAQYH